MPSSEPSHTSDLAMLEPDQILSTLPDLIFEVDDQHRLVALHGSSSVPTHLPPEEFLGEDYRDVLPESVAEAMNQAFARLKETGEMVTTSYRLPINGEMRSWQARILPGPKAGWMIVVVRDMTDEWLSKSAVAQSEDRYRTLVNNIPGVVYRCHIDDVWSAIFVSPGIEDLLGYSVDDFISGGETLGSFIHPEDRSHVQELVMDAVDNDRPFHVSYRAIDAEGQIRHITERGQAIYDDHDQRRYLDGAFFDVTDMHHMRQEVLVNSKMAAVGNLAAGVAHEINNPLAIAMANLEYVAEEVTDVIDAVDADPHVEEALDDISIGIGKVQTAIDRVRAIVDDLRTFTDAAEGLAQQVDLRRLVEWVIRRVRTKSRNPIDLTVSLDDVPSIWASEVGAVQVLWNLLDNAVEAIQSQGGDGTIRISLYSEDDHVYLIVDDNGPGMAPEIAQRAFEPFYTTKQVGQGAGLGLFVCQGLIKGMDGTIDVETQPGEGTRVTVSFPAYEAPLRPDRSHPSA